MYLWCMSLTVPYLKIGSVPGLLLFVYILCCGFQNLFHFPVIEDRLQLPEIVFTIASFWLLTSTYKQWSSIWTTYKTFLIPCFLWLIAHAFSFAWAPSLQGLLESLGVCYLIFVLLFFLAYFNTLPKETSYKFWVQAFRTLGWLMTSTGLLFYILSITIWPNDTAQVYINYPYFGDSYRLQGFTTTPSMYVSIITMCIASCLCNGFFYERKKSDVLAGVIFSIVAVLTLAKSILFILFLWSAFLLYAFRLPKFLVPAVLLVLSIVHFLSSHFLIMPDQTKSDQGLLNSPYSSNEMLFRVGDYTVVASGYYCFKKTAWYLFRQNPLHGTGPGNYNSQVEHLKKTGIYPSHLPNYDPHSTYFGALAVLGWPGFAALLLLCLSLYSFLSAGRHQNGPFHFTLIILAGILLAEAISMDIMNFRHYWIYFAMVLAFNRRKPDISDNMTKAI